MRKIREVLRLKYEQGRSHRQIAASCAIVRVPRDRDRPDRRIVITEIGAS